MKGRIILAGGSGFIGRHLCELFADRGDEIVILSRGPDEKKGSVRYAHWDGRTVGDWLGFVDGARAVINLAGKSINCRPTPKNRQEIVESRVNSVQALGQAIKRCSRPPECFVQASAIGIYRSSRDCCCDETAPYGNQFEATVCKAWESAVEQIDAPGMRNIIFRQGVVLGRDGGLLKVLGRLTKWFLGGHVGDGGQFVSWIHIDDLAQMFSWATERNDITGVFNATSPNPVTNKQLMRELRSALHRPYSPPVPVLAVRIGSWIMGANAELALTSHRCTPSRFLEKRFQFRFPDVRGALADIYRRS